MTAVKKVLIIVLLFAVFVSVFIFAVEMLTETSGESVYVLRAEDNTVALYRDGEFVESYADIAVDTLPVSDRRRLREGIEFSNADDARREVEDYDG